MLKPVHIHTINTDAERLARSSQGTSRDIEAVARAWDKDALVLPNMFKRGSITIATLKPLPPEAKKHIALAAPVTTHIMYEVDGVEEDHGPDDSHDRSDPWVKVGTTTIDGTVMQVATMLEASAWGPPVNDDEAEAHIDNFVRCGGPWLIGGRHLLPRGSHINGNLGTALIRCDIVRRQSEIEAEGAAKQAEFDREVATMEARDYPHGLPRPPCPECGPHGNRGEVLLASSWAKCTTCAGGKPGDLWGEVRKSAFPGVKSYTLAIGDLVFDEEVEVKRGPQSPAIIATAGTAENLMKFEIALRRHLTSDTPTRYDDATIAKWANIVCNLSPGDWIT